MRLWRISDFSDLKGRGGQLASARWHTKGRPVVYLAENPAGAMMERLVHMFQFAGKVPRTYHLLEIEADDSLVIHDLLPLADAQWRDRIDLTRAAGDRWLAAAASLLAKVPSAVVPRTWNYLFNPLHPDAPRVAVVSELNETFDARLFESRPH
jgi:RES domain-containing protein